MALSKRSFANLEAIKDDDVRDVVRILYDRIHDLQSKSERGVAVTLSADLDAKDKKVRRLADPTDGQDALSLDFADNRYEPFRIGNASLQDAAVAKLVGLGLTEAEARSLI